MSSFDYRVDCVAVEPTEADYTTPCGMNTIIWHSEYAPNLMTLTNMISPMLNPGFVGLVSKWKGKKYDGNYTVIAIITHKD